MSNELMKQEQQSMTVTSVLRQVELIQDLLKNVMKQDEHFGVIEGCGNKPTLLKAGAEKICFTFRLAPTFEVHEREYESGHREYRVDTTLRHIETGNIVGAGVGVASTQETKWKYRKDIQDTGKPIPADYKDNKGKYKEQGFVAVKIDDGWKWCTLKRIEHENPADYYNTVLKMAKKRSQVDAVLTATACSDIFAQDLEEIGEQIAKVEKREPIKETVVEKNKLDTTPNEIDPNAMRDYRGIIEDVKEEHGTNNKTKKPWTRYGIVFKDGAIFGTFDTKLAETAISLLDAEVILTYKDDGKFKTAETISPTIFNSVVA